MKGRFATVLTLVLVVVPPIIAGTAKPSVVINGTFVNDPTSPLMIESMKKTVTDQIAELTVKNQSAKTITSFELGWLIIAPDTCASSRSEPVRVVAPSRPSLIEPGGTDVTKDYQLLSDALVRMAKEKSTVLLHYQVAVMSVTFADGSKWTKATEGNAVFSNNLLNGVASRCKEGKLLPSATCVNCEGSIHPSNSSSVQSIDPKMAIAGATPNAPTGCYYTCINETGGAHQYCTNSVNSCTVHVCSGACPGQFCQLVCP